MKKWIVLFALSAVLTAFPNSGGSQQVVVATKQVPLQTKTFLFKLPVEAQRGERWQIVKQGNDKVSVTFGPNDERKKMLQSLGQKKTPQYELNAKAFLESFVPESSWPEVRRDFAMKLKERFSALSVEQCEKIIDGELWVGMTKDQAFEAVGNRILRKESRETREGASETWQVGAFSIMTTAEGSAKSHVYDEMLATPSTPSASLDSKLARDLDSNTRLVLTFIDGELSEIVRKS